MTTLRLVLSFDPFYIVQLIHSLSIASRDQVTVGVHGDLDAVMAKLVFDVGQALTLLDK